MNIEDRLTDLEKRVAALEKKAAAATTAIDSEQFTELVLSYLPDSFNKEKDLTSD